MPIKNAQVLGIVERISEHYQQNIANRYLRNAFGAITLDKGAWEKLERLTETSEYDRIQGYTLKELYEGIYFLAVFIKKVRSDIAPNLRVILVNQKPVGNERLIMDMTVSNFAANLGILADMVNELYMITVEFDKAQSKGRAPFYMSMPELSEVGKMLIAV